MYSILLTNDNNNDFYNIKINLNLKEKFINLYNLKEKGLHKSYYKNNIQIISDNETPSFYKVFEKDIYVKDNYLFIEHEKVLIEPFSFYETDYEEEYKLYENTIDDVNTINDVIINFKEFKDYGELEFITDDLNKFNNLFK